jgi:undecaprenyl-diphosphatase
MSLRAFRRRPAALAPVILVTTAALAFTVLLVMVRLGWRPLESVDHGAAASINNLITGQGTAVVVLKDVTLLGSTLVLSAAIAAAALLLVLRRRWRLAAYLVVTGAGALILDPILKALIGRLRPVVAHPVAHAPGNSFPSGHSLGSIVCYGAIFLIFAAAAPRRWRTWLAVLTAVIVAAVGISRILLGVHYISDVVGGWSIGIAWLGLTSFAFELTRQAAGRPVSHPVAEGLEPEAGADLKLARPEITTTPGAGGFTASTPRRGTAAARVGIAWVLILGVMVGIGELLTRDNDANVLGDITVPRWLAAHRTPTLTRWSLVFTTLGGTVAIATAAAVISLIFVGLTRRWRPAVYLVTLLLGELAMFLTAAAVVRRPRPAVTHLDHHLPTSSYPSGHVAATCCLYIGLAILVIGHAKGWWRWLFVIPAIVMPVLVAGSRMYRGEHHPTDVLASFAFSALWIPPVTLLIRPAAPTRTGSQPSLRRRINAHGHVRGGGRPGRPVRADR